MSSPDNLWLQSKTAQAADPSHRPAFQTVQDRKEGSDLLTDIELCRIASEIRKNAYAPYSEYFVGAALLTTNNKVFRGCNIENVTFGLTICAERAAIFSAVVEGEKNFQAIALATEDVATPCGSCRQVLAEFCNDSFPILLSDGQGELKIKTTLGELLPNAFRGELPVRTKR